MNFAATEYFEKLASPAEKIAGPFTRGLGTALTGMPVGGLIGTVGGMTGESIGRGQAISEIDDPKMRAALRTDPRSGLLRGLGTGLVSAAPVAAGSILGALGGAGIAELADFSPADPEAQALFLGGLGTGALGGGVGGHYMSRALGRGRVRSDAESEQLRQLAEETPVT